MMAFLLLNGPSWRVLMIGLGGGSFAKFVYHRLPEAVTEVLEINPQVVAVARRLFELPDQPCAQHQPVAHHLGLGRRFLERREQELRDAHVCRGVRKAAILPNAPASSTTMA